MPGIVIAALIATLLALAIIGPLILRHTPVEERGRLLVIWALHLPMCAAASHFLRQPLDAQLVSWLGMGSGAHRFLTTFYAPLTEEPAKLWLLLTPWLLSRLNRENSLRHGMTIGLGFGVGELWLIAYWVTLNPSLSGAPWFAFIGFIQERIMVCVMHGVFTSAALRTIRAAPVRSVLFAMLLHYTGNFPIYLSQVRIPPLPPVVWQLVLVLWVMFYFVAMLAVVGWLYPDLGGMRQFLRARAQCPECGFIYPRLWLANLNVRMRYLITGWKRVYNRYERCPNCKKFHWAPTCPDDLPPDSKPAA